MADRNELRIAALAADPPSLDPFGYFNAESLLVLSLLNDGLVAIDADGEVQRANAVQWQWESPTCLGLTLRNGVRFHNGEPFTAADVAATFAVHQDRLHPTLMGKMLFSGIKSVEAKDPRTVRVTTHQPDAMLLHRLSLLMAYPEGLLRQGIEAVRSNPEGTGAYRLAEWSPGERVVLERNPGHWMKLQGADRLVFPILRPNEWVDRLAAGDADLAVNVDPTDAARARVLNLHVHHQRSARSCVGLLRAQGPLADVRVRRALNHAVHRDLLVDVAQQGEGAPAAGLVGRGQPGHVADLEPYAYDPARARQLLAEAGFADGVTLRGVVSAPCSAVFLLVREFLSRVGVRLEADIVPQSQWMQTLAVDRTLHGVPFPGDFLLCCTDNLLGHGLFAHFRYLFSGGPHALLADPVFDRGYLEAESTTDPAGLIDAIQRLERSAHDQALMLFLTRQHIYAVTREDADVLLPVTGHFAFEAMWDLTQNDPVSRPERGATPLSPRLREVLDATGRPGEFYPPAATSTPDRGAERVWSHLKASQDRWLAELDPMVKTLVSQADAKAPQQPEGEATPPILDHLPHALVCCDREGRIRPGYARSCDAYFRLKGADIEGARLTDALGLSARGGHELLECFEHAFADEQSESLTMGQFPPRLYTGDRVFALSASVVRNPDGSVQSVMCSLTDVSAEVRAHQQLSHIRGILAVVRERDAFVALAGNFLGLLGEAQRVDLAVEASQKWLRWELRSYQDAFGGFEQDGVCREIHSLVGASWIGRVDVERIRQGFVDYVKRHQEYWHFDLERKLPEGPANEAPNDPSHGVSS